MGYTIWASSALSWQCLGLLTFKSQEEKREPYELPACSVLSQRAKELVEVTRPLGHYLS